MMKIFKKTKIFKLKKKILIHFPILEFWFNTTLTLMSNK